MSHYNLFLVAFDNNISHQPTDRKLTTTKCYQVFVICTFSSPAHKLQTSFLS